MVLILCEGCDRETIPLLEDLHLLEPRSRAELCDRYDTRELLHILDIYTHPYRLLSSRLRIIVLASLSELRLIGMSD